MSIIGWRLSVASTAAASQQQKTMFRPEFSSMIP
jgi:hypothetical protein